MCCMHCCVRMVLLGVTNDASIATARRVQDKHTVGWHAMLYKEGEAMTSPRAVLIKDLSTRRGVGAVHLLVSLHAPKDAWVTCAEALQTMYCTVVLLLFCTLASAVWHSCAVLYLVAICP